MPIQLVCDECQSEYSVRDEMAGKKVRCKQCGAVLEIPHLVEEDDGPAVDRGYDPAFARDLFLMKQKRIAIHEKYYVFDERKRPILFIERPRHWLRSCGGLVAGLVFISVGVVLSAALGMALGGGNGRMDTPAAGVAFFGGLLVSVVAGIAIIIWITPKRHISVYSDDTRATKLLEIAQDQKVSFWKSTYTVADTAGGILGRCKKVYIHNLLRKRWYVYDPDGRLYLVVKEDSLLLSLMRRFLPPALMIFIARTNFIMHEPGEDRVLGEFNRKLTFFDEYVLDISADRDHVIDRRMAIAIGVLLDTGERR